jgi:hypothetical protein
LILAAFAALASALSGGGAAPRRHRIPQIDERLIPGNKPAMAARVRPELAKARIRSMTGWAIVMWRRTGGANLVPASWTRSQTAGKPDLASRREPRGEACHVRGTEL